MSDNILLVRKMSEIENDIKKAIMALKELIENPSSEYTDEQIKEWKENLYKLEEELDQLDGNRHYLINPDKNNKVIIDFRKRFGSYNLETVYKNGQELIEVRYQDGNDTDCVCVLNYKGIEVVPECREYKFAGNEVLIQQQGYMLGYDTDSSFWSVAYTDKIVAQSIEYLDQFKIFLVNHSDYYNNGLEHLGKVENHPDIEGHNILVYKKNQ